MDRQSQTRRRGCHCWELQKGLFSLLFSDELALRGSSQHGLHHVFDRFHAAYDKSGTKISAQGIQGSVFCKCVEIHCRLWRRSSALATEIGTKRLIHGLVKQTQFCVGSFQRPQSFQILNRSLFRSLPVVMNLRWRLKEYCEKNKRLRWDIFEEFSVWHFVTKSTGLKSVNPGMSRHSSETRDPSYVSSAMWPECPRKDWRSKSFGLQSTPTGKRPRGGQRTRWSNCISDLAWYRLGVKPAELSEIAVDREVLCVLLMLLPLAILPKGNPGNKMNEWVCRPTLKFSIYEIVFTLFAKSECIIQIIKHIWTETCVFVKISSKCLT